MNIQCTYSALVETDKLLLQQNPKNNNKHTPEQVERLAKIIDFAGQRRPIVVSNRSGFIIKGHCTLLAIAKLGWSKVAVDFQNYETEAAEYQDMTADNEIAKWAIFDKKKFKDELKGLDLGDFELLGIKDFDFLNEIEVDITANEKDNDSFNFIIKCDDMEQVEVLQKKFDTNGTKIAFDKIKGLL